MIKIESLKDYVGKISTNEFMYLANEIYQIIDSIGEDYPKHKEWYFNKQLPAITSDERNILFVRNPDNPKEILAMACLKKDREEQKICTLYVSDKYRGLGIGTSLIETSMNWLLTTKPLITITEYKLEMFDAIIKKYNWELTDIVTGLYNDRYKELCYNGTLLKKEELATKLVRLLNKRKEDLKSFK